MDIKVSVIIPVYNVQDYIEQCLESVLNQTLKEIEIILIDDGSTDDSMQRVERFLNDKRITLITQKNQGLSVARNSGLKNAKGEFILYLDSDDYLESECLEILCEKIEYTKSDIVIFSHKEIYDDTIKGNNVDAKIAVDENKIYSGIEVADMVLNCKFLGTAWNKLFRRKNLLESNMHFEQGRYVQDWFPVFRQIFMANQVAFVNTPLYNYRMRGTATTAKKTQKNIDDYRYAANQILNFAITNKMKKESIDYFKYVVYFALVGRNFNTYSTNLKKVYAKENYQEFKISNSEIFYVNSLSFRRKVEIVLFNLKIYHVYIKLESSVRKILRK